MTTLKEIKEIITVSKGNTKLGNIPSLSLPPISTCMEQAPCIKSCYAMKAWRLYPSVRKAYIKNLNSFINNYAIFTDAFWSWLDKKKPEYFRYHVSGDIPNKKYLNFIFETADLFPFTKFRLFTKKYELFEPDLNVPENVKIGFSSWPGLELPKQNKFRIAFMQDGTETRVDGTEFKCVNDCRICKACWELDKNVVFNKH